MALDHDISIIFSSIYKMENDKVTPYFDSVLDSMTWHAQVDFIF